MSLCLEQEEDRSHLAEERTEVQTGRLKEPNLVRCPRQQDLDYWSLTGGAAGERGREEVTELPWEMVFPARGGSKPQLHHPLGTWARCHLFPEAASWLRSPSLPYKGQGA